MNAQTFVALKLQNVALGAFKLQRHPREEKNVKMFCVHEAHSAVLMANASMHAHLLYGWPPCIQKKKRGAGGWGRRFTGIHRFST